MSIIGTVFLALLGMTTIAGLSLALYSLLPAEVLNFASEHSRYTGLGVPDSTDDASGNAPRPALGALQGQSV